MKKFKIGARYKLRKEDVGHLWFTSPAETHCSEKYGVQRHVFTGVCVSINDVGANLQLDDNNVFFAANDERDMFKRVKNK